VQISYQQAADILNEFLPDLSCFSHATTRNRVLAVGKMIEAEARAEIAETKSSPQSATSMNSRVSGFVRLSAVLDVGSPPISLFSPTEKTP
jgi:hypothetical protein